jgi:hypothetical protein
VTGHAWRVTWHRSAWSGYAKSRTFERQHDVEAFLAKLMAGDRPELSPLDRLELHRRPVGQWEALELPGGAQ